MVGGSWESCYGKGRTVTVLETGQHHTRVWEGGEACCGHAVREGGEGEITSMYTCVRMLCTHV